MSTPSTLYLWMWIVNMLPKLRTRIKKKTTTHILATHSCSYLIKLSILDSHCSGRRRNIAKRSQLPIYWWFGELEAHGLLDIMRPWIASTDWILFNLQISIVVCICSCRIRDQLVTTFMHRNCGVILAFLGKRRRPANAQPRTAGVVFLYFLTTSPHL